MIYFFFPAAAFRRAAQRAFIICDSFRRPAAVIPPTRFFAAVARARDAEPWLLPSSALIAVSRRSRCS